MLKTLKVAIVQVNYAIMKIKERGGKKMLERCKMKQKILNILLIGIISLGLIGCTNGNNNNNNGNAGNNNSTTPSTMTQIVQKNMVSEKHSNLMDWK